MTEPDEKQTFKHLIYAHVHKRFGDTGTEFLRDEEQKAFNDGLKGGYSQCEQTTLKNALDTLDKIRDVKEEVAVSASYLKGWNDCKTYHGIQKAADNAREG